jgi:hypothetical protein
MNKRIAVLVLVILPAAVLLPLGITLATFVNVVVAAQGRGAAPAAAKPPGPIPRMPDGKPDLTGFYQSEAGGANYGLERHDRDFLTPGTRGVVVDPPDGKLPTQPWARRTDERSSLARIR